MASASTLFRRAMVVGGVGVGTAVVLSSVLRTESSPLARDTRWYQHVNLGASYLYFHFGHRIRPWTDAEQAHLDAIKIAALPDTVRGILGLTLPQFQYENLRTTLFDQRGAQQAQQRRQTNSNNSSDGASTDSFTSSSSSSSSTPPLKPLYFSHPLGLAAGFDKHGEAVDGLLSMGFSFVEVGSVTPEPQDGNPRPRVFRLEEDRAIINRYGFNSHGADAVSARLAARAHKRDLDERPTPGLLGVNLGKNKDTLQAKDDYVLGIDKLAQFADYIVVNVSSPNTPGLRALQQKSELADLLSSVKSRRDGQFASRSLPAPPLFVKIAPDLDESAAQDIAEVVLATGVDGLIISNTTVARPDELRSHNKVQVGGLSGAPLKHVSTDLIRDMYKRTKGRVVIIGVGGVENGVDAYAKIRAGASLVQVYSSFAYGGPYQLHIIKRDLSQLLKRDGFKNVQDAVGADVRQAAATATATK